MAEPAQTAEIAASGSLGVALAIRGVSPGLLLLSCLGGGIGVLLTKDMPRATAIATFVLSAPAGALLGGSISHDPSLSRLLSFAASAMAIPLLVGLREALQTRTPDIWGSALDRLLQMLRIKS